MYVLMVCMEENPITNANDGKINEVCSKTIGSCSECDEEFLDKASKLLSPSESDIIMITYEST